MFSNSLFANFAHKEVPGMEDILSIVEERVERIEYFFDSYMLGGVLSVPISLFVLTILSIGGFPVIYMVFFMFWLACFALLASAIEGLL